MAAPRVPKALEVQYIEYQVPMKKKKERMAMKENSPLSTPPQTPVPLHSHLCVRMSPSSPITKRAMASTNGMKPGAKNGNSCKEISKDAWYKACITKNSMEAFKQMTMTQHSCSLLSWVSIYWDKEAKMSSLLNTGSNMKMVNSRLQEETNPREQEASSRLWRTSKFNRSTSAGVSVR
jgi:hypothetical protein